MIKQFKISCLIVTISLLLASCTGVFDRSISSNERLAALNFRHTPKNVTLMLPFQGRLSNTSHAIKNGFLTAYHSLKTIHPNITINIVDTTNANIIELYKQAVANSADIVIGPLTKQEVNTIATLNTLEIPVIALNTVDNYRHHPISNLYQFGLIPQDEINDIVIKLINNNYTKIAIIAQNSQWGKNIAKTFATQYTMHGGKIATTAYYIPHNNIPDQICEIITANPNQMCIKHTQKPLIQRRQDIDAIFLIASPTEARTIVPSLKFYYAGDLPLYATSSVYSGAPNQNLDQDLDGVQFMDMPWILQVSLDSKLQTIRSQVLAAWPESLVNNTKLYALGVDAYQLSLSLSDMINRPNTGIDGVTGKLYLDKYNHIYRKSIWTTIIHGVPQSL